MFEFVSDFDIRISDFHLKLRGITNFWKNW